MLLINFYRLRKEATIETMDKYSIGSKLSYIGILYSCIYDIIFFNVKCNKYGYIVYMRNTYFNIGIYNCCTILKEFTTKSMRKQGISRNLIDSIKYKVKLITGDSYDEKSNIIGYIKSL